MIDRKMIVFAVICVLLGFFINMAYTNISINDTKDQIVTESLIKKDLIVETNRVIADIQTEMRKAKIDTPLVLKLQELRQVGIQRVEKQDTKINSLLNLLEE